MEKLPKLPKLIKLKIKPFNEGFLAIGVLYLDWLNIIDTGSDTDNNGI